VSALQDWQPPSLSGAARERILQQLVAARPKPAEPRRTVPQLSLLLAAGALACAAALAVMLRGGHAPLPPPSLPTLSEVSQHQQFSGTGTVPFGDAQLGYRAGTVLDLSPEARSVALDAGELDVEARTALRVTTTRFIVRLTQAHAVFAADSVRVTSGEVFVYSLDQQLLAQLGAGQSWPRPAVAPVVVAAPEPVAPPKVSAAAALDRARSALAGGDAPTARRWIQRALAGEPSQHDRAEAELFAAESYLVEARPARAVEQYRLVAGAYGQLPEGEAAAFAAAQVLSESGSAAQSHEAFRAYLDRYPEGRFAREARDRLSATAGQ
jgi:hypothetical protein